MRVKDGEVDEIPLIHGLMIKCAMGVLVLCLIGYIFAPDAKAGFLREFALLVFAFLTGKFTNGFGLRPGSRRSRSSEE